MPPKRTPIGRLRDRVTIQAPSAGTPDAYGQIEDTWSDVASVYAEIAALSGAEAYRMAQVQPTVTLQVTMHHRSDVTPDKRIKFGERVLHPVFVDSDPYLNQTRVYCRENL